MHKIDKLIPILESKEKLTFDQSFKTAKYCSKLINNEEYRHAERLIIQILNNWCKIDENTIEIWIDLIELLGFYPYLMKENLSNKLNNLPAEIRMELHHSTNLSDKYFHQEQLEILRLLNDGKNVIVSAPTSFGKSLLIEELIASNKYSNIVIIQPTLALLDETRRKLLKYRNKFNLIIRTTQEPSIDKGNIYLFTAERVNEYQKFTNIDFIVIDEFYKLSGNRDDERSSSLNNAFHYLLKYHNPNFYLLGPNIDGISEGFTEKYNAIFYKSNYSLVDSKQIDIYKEYKNKFATRGPKAKYKELILFELLMNNKDEQSIIYCSSPNRVRKLAKSFAKYLSENSEPKSKQHYPLIAWIKKYVSKSWSLINILNFDIGIHDGALQKHISTSIIDYFNSGKIKFLFCTSTIIEGVNTSAKNIIYFDPKKGPNPVDFFDYSNIKGRAGRMMIHYVGNIYNFNPPPQKEQIIIDIPFHQQNPIKDEVLIQLDDIDIKDKFTDQYRKINEIPPKEKEVIKNNGVQVDGQKNLFDEIRSLIDKEYNLLAWNLPNYEQLTFILGLCWDHLIIPGETTRPMTKGKLVNMTFNYGNNQDINALIRDSYNYMRKLDKNKKIKNAELLDIAIQETFQVLKHWFQYKVPKWLSVINEIQKFVCSERGYRPGNYLYYANLIENDFIRENLSILSEFGIPSTAIRKIEGKIPETLNQDDVLDFIKQKELYNLESLINYERDKIIENLTD